MGLGKQTWGRVAAWLLAGALLGAGRHAPKLDVFDQAPPKTDADLLIHPANTDLSAYRLDCEVFGFSKDLKQIAAIGSEVYRGPKGKHRGEAFLLVYNIGQPLPVHNIIGHVITHADLPHDPVPIEDARDLLWVIENSYLEMWPKRPFYKHVKGWMSVEVLVQPIPQGGDVCTPAVGFALTYRGKHRYMPFIPLDMKVNCGLLKNTDSRTYWGKRDVSASMVRFDYSPSQDNEHSARFVVGAAWEKARPLRVMVEESAPFSRDSEDMLRQTLSRLGSVQFRQVPAQPGEPQDGPIGVTDVAAHAADSALAAYLSRTLNGYGTRRLDDTETADIVVRVGRAAQTPAVEVKPEAPPTEPVDSSTVSAEQGAAQTAHLQMTPVIPSDADGVPSAKQDVPSAPTPPTDPVYIKDWKVP